MPINLLANTTTRVFAAYDDAPAGRARCCEFVRRFPCRKITRIRLKSRDTSTHAHIVLFGGSSVSRVHLLAPSGGSRYADRSLAKRRLIGFQGASRNARARFQPCVSMTFSRHAKSRRAAIRRAPPSSMTRAVDTSPGTPGTAKHPGRPRRELKMFVWLSHEECREALSKVRRPCASSVREFPRPDTSIAPRRPPGANVDFSYDRALTRC